MVNTKAVGIMSRFPSALYWDRISNWRDNFGMGIVTSECEAEKNVPKTKGLISLFLNFVISNTYLFEDVCKNEGYMHLLLMNC